MGLEIRSRCDGLLGARDVLRSAIARMVSGIQFDLALDRGIYNRNACAHASDGSFEMRVSVSSFITLRHQSTMSRSPNDLADIPQMDAGSRSILRRQRVFGKPELSSAGLQRISGRAGSRSHAEECRNFCHQDASLPYFSIGRMTTERVTLSI